MWNEDTFGGIGRAAPFLFSAIALFSHTLIGQSGAGQSSSLSAATDWRQIGNSAIAQGLAGVSSGPVSRAWFSSDGALYTATPSGRVFRTSDFEAWQPVTEKITRPISSDANVLTQPEPNAHARSLPQNPGRVYAFGDFVYASRDNGAHWENVTGFRGHSIIGSPVYDLAISVQDAENIVAATANGVFHSVDGGRSWDSLNQGLPVLDARRILSLPGGTQGTRIATASDAIISWNPGEKQAWLPSTDAQYTSELQMKTALSQRLALRVTSFTSAETYFYAGTDGGALLVSSDQGNTWRVSSLSGAGTVERIWIDPQDPRVALAVFSGSAPVSGNAPRVVHTVNGGGFWEDLTNNLPANASVYSVTADRASGALYAATAEGLFLAYSPRGTLSNPSRWTKLQGLPDARVMDVRLDAQGHQLWAAVDGFGVYASIAPHRLRDPKVVTSADLVSRAVAPGSLLSVLGTQFDSVSMNGAAAPLLAADSGATQIQVPFDVRGTSVSVAGLRGGASVNLPALVLSSAAPAIFVATDGSPMLLDADHGLMLDAMNPARSGTNIQVLATGLGRVKPEWPSGVPAPSTRPPAVAGNVKAYLDRVQVEVTRATLAPGYAGLYLVELAIPRILDFGPAELMIEVDGAQSNPVRVYIEP